METSILNSTKKILGISEDYTAFDHDIITHINTAFSFLTQLGIGSEAGFMIQDDTAVWSDFVLDTDIPYNSIKSYIFLRVRLLFDPPTTSYLISAYEDQIRELEWRMSVYREGSEWIDPNPIVIDDVDAEENILGIIDGGVI